MISNFFIKKGAFQQKRNAPLINNKGASRNTKRPNHQKMDDLLPYVGINQQVQRVRFYLLNAKASPRKQVPYLFFS